jgi:hypothetical protein
MGFALWVEAGDQKFPNNFSLTGGEGGIRTPDTVARMPHFECGAFNHSATSPKQTRKGLSGVRRI